MNSINAFLDSLPRTRLLRLGQQVPAYRALGMAGFYAGLAWTVAGVLITGRSLILMSCLDLVSVLSFFLYAHLRRLVTGEERMVLLEHVWIALGACAALLWVLKEPVPGYLDILSIGICIFLSAGRAGCTLVGCCYGQPASIGIVYGEDAARDGFPRALAGVRLFPVAAIEMLGLLAIALSGTIALPFARSGLVFAWFLATYAILRFALEGLRGDPRPHFLGLSQARWMALLQMAAVLCWSDGHRFSRAHMEVAGCGAGVLVASLAILHLSDWRRRVLKASHLAELRAFTKGELPLRPLVHATSAGVRIAVSKARTASVLKAHVSISLPDDRVDLPLLCELGARAFPGLFRNDASASGGRILHLLIPVPISGEEADRPNRVEESRALYGAVLRKMQVSPASVAGPPVAPKEFQDTTVSLRRPWYFTITKTH